MKGFRWLPAFLLLLLLAGRARADVECEVVFGHDGNAVSGAITPVSVKLTNRETAPLAVAIEARLAGSTVTGEISTTRDTLSPGATKEFTFFTRPWGGSNLRVTLDFGRRVQVRQKDRASQGPVSSWEITATRPQFGPQNESPSAVQILAVGTHAALLPPTRTEIRVIPLEEGLLHDVWHAYDGLDVVYWRNPGEGAPFDRAKLRALLRWVELGGRLVVSAPTRPDLLRGSALEEVLPATPGLGSAGGVDYLALVAPIKGWPWTDKDGELPPRGALTPLQRVRGAVICGTPADPYAVERAHGLGTIVMLAFDPARFATAKGPLAAALYLLMARGERTTRNPVRELAEFSGGRDGRTWLPDEESPMGGILDLLKRGSVRPPPMGLLLLFMLLYVVAVGPVDYFVLKKRKLLKYSALSFLGLAVIFSVGAYFVSFYLFSGAARVNRITLVDVVPSAESEGSDTVEINDFAGFYAPRGATIELSLAADTAFFSDFVLPEEYVYRAGTLTRDPIYLDATSPVRPTAELRIPFRSLRTARTVALREGPFPLDVLVTPGESVVVVNDTDWVLRDPMLLSADGVLRCPDVEPGERTKVAGAPVSLGRYSFWLGEAGRMVQPKRGDIAALVDDQGNLASRNAARLGRVLMQLSVGSALLDPGEIPGPRERLARKAGLDRGDVLERGGTLFLAWCDARDPLGLPAGRDAGITVTLIRKVIQP